MTNESERAKFEAWASPLRFIMTRDGDGYENIETDASWYGWLGRAQSSGPVVPAGELEALAAAWDEKRAPHHASDHIVGIADGYDLAAQELRKLIAKHTGRE